MLLGAIAVTAGWWGIVLGALLLGWAIAGLLGKVKPPASWLLPPTSTSTVVSVVSVALGGMVTTCGVIGVVAPEPDSDEAARARPATTSSTDAGRADRRERPASPRLPNAADIPLTLIENNDHQSPIKDQKSRVLLMRRPMNEEELRKALSDYYSLMRAELEHSSNDVRHVWLFAYPTEARAKAGMGEWEGRAQAIATGGEPLPTTPELTINMPKADEERPTAREDEIYDALMKELQAVDSAGDYQEKVMAKRGALSKKDLQKMATLQERDEARVMRKIAKRYKMTVAELEKLHIKVLSSRM